MSIGRAALLVVAGACGAPPAARMHDEVAEHRPHVDLAIASGKTVRVLHLTDTGLVVDRTVTVPDEVIAIAWSSADPIVWVKHGETAQLGRLAPSGFVALAEPAWRPRAHEPDEQAVALEPPHYSLFAATGGQTWAGFCDHAFLSGLAPCMKETVYARVDSGPGEVFDELPPLVPAYQRHDPAQAPAGYELAISSLPNDIGRGGTTSVLTCTGPDGSIAYPTPDDRETSSGYDDPIWIALSPPLFVATKHLLFPVPAEPRFFAGCHQTADYTSLRLGPDDTTWLTGPARIDVYWHGKKIGFTQPGEIAFHVP